MTHYTYRDEEFTLVIGDTYSTKDNQKFELIRLEPDISRDKQETTVGIWVGKCLKCKKPYEEKTSIRSKYIRHKSICTDCKAEFDINNKVVNFAKTVNGKPITATFDVKKLDKPGKKYKKFYEWVNGLKLNHNFSHVRYNIIHPCRQKMNNYHGLKAVLLLWCEVNNIGYTAAQERRTTTPRKDTETKKRKITMEELAEKLQLLKRKKVKNV